MSYVFAALLAIIGIALVLAIKGYSRSRVIAAREYASATREFFEAADPLMSDDDTPDEIIEAISMLNSTIEDRSMARWLASYPLHPRVSAKAKRLTKVAEEFFAARPELEESFKRMFSAWFVAVTALAPLAGAAARYSLNNDESITRAATRAGQSKLSGHNDDNGTPRGHHAVAA